MRVAFVVMVLASSSFAKEPKLVSVSGLAEESLPWCGGAMPPAGRAQEVRPHAKQTFHVKAGAKNSAVKPTVTFTTDAKGRFSISLGPGAWCVVPAARVDVPPSEAAKRPRPPGSAVAAPGGPPDFACLDHHWAECTAVLEVADQPLTNARVMTFQSCGFTRPCQAPGPQPPSAPPSSVD